MLVSTQLITLEFNTIIFNKINSQAIDCNRCITRFLLEFNPVNLKFDHHQFSPSNLHTFSREIVVRIIKVINKGKLQRSFIKFSKHSLGNVLRTVWRICTWILGLKGSKKEDSEMQPIAYNWSFLHEGKLSISTSQHTKNLRPSNNITTLHFLAKKLLHVGPKRWRVFNLHLFSEWS